MFPILGMTDEVQYKNMPTIGMTRVILGMSRIIVLDVLHPQDGGE